MTTEGVQPNLDRAPAAVPSPRSDGLALAARLFLMLVIGAGCPAARSASRVKVPVPTRAEVGAACMPDVLAPVEAPFPMPSFQKPRFPERTVDITRYGATPHSPATASIQAALDHVGSQGGGTVVVPPGRWRTGRISLRSHVNLHLAKGAELRFSGRLEDYRPAVYTRSAGFEVMSLGALVYAHGQTNIALTGKGTLVGPPLDCPVRNQALNYGSLDAIVTADVHTPVSQRVYEGWDGARIFLPAFFSPIQCRDVYLEGVTLEQTAFWNIVPIYCDGVIIRGITVNSVGIPMGDGMDIESSRNVLIEYSTLNCGDDCFTLKAGRNQDGLRVGRPTENVVIRRCLAQEGHGGITLGSETAGGIRNLLVQDCVFEGTGTGIRFKTRRPRGGGGEQVTLERIRMNVGVAIRADMLGSSRYVGALADRLPPRPVNALTPAFRNITMRDLLVEQATTFVKINGIPESPFANLRIENADVRCHSMIHVADAQDLTFRNIHIQSRSPDVGLLDAGPMVFDNVRFDVPGGRVIVKHEGGRTNAIRFLDCQPDMRQYGERQRPEGSGD